MSAASSRFRSLLHETPTVAARRSAAGLPCHLVGGVLRDAVLGLARRDLDLVVAGDGARFAHALGERIGARVVALGADRFAAFRLVAADSVVDVWGRGGTSLEADLMRRDLTVNAIALDIVDGTVHDPAGGLADLERRRLRCVSERSFPADPLRVMRAARLAVTLPGFALDPATLDLARTHSEALDRVAGERIRDELNLLIEADDLPLALRLLRDIDQFPRLWSRSADVAAALGGLAAMLTTGAATEAAVEQAAGRRPARRIWVESLIAGQLAIGNAEDSARAIVSRLEQRRYLSRLDSRRIQRLATSTPAGFDLTPRRFLASTGDLWPEATVLAAASGAPTPLPHGWLAEAATLLATEGHAVLAPRPLINGSEVQRLLSLKPGPAVGRVLDQLLAAQIDGRVTSPDEARAYVASLRSAPRP